MMDIIKTDVPTHEQGPWEIAASQWRLPYWDWAAHQPYIKNYGLPEICTLEKINIVLPNSNHEKVPVDNPLWKFSNPSGKQMGDPSMGKLAIPADDIFPVC